MEQVVLLMGGNVGDTSELLSRARELLSLEVGAIVGCSSEVETEPWGFEGVEREVAKFVNQAVVVATRLKPEELLKVTQKIEKEVGREREQEQQEREITGGRYASRMIDIDIIFYGQRVVSLDRLAIPHPLMQERSFVLRPMVEVAAEWIHPLLGRSCRELLNELENR